MDSINECVIIPEPRVAACPTNLKTDEDGMRIQADGVSNNVQTEKSSASSDVKNSKMTAEDGNLSFKRRQTGEVSNKSKTSKSLVKAGKIKNIPSRDCNLPLKRRKQDHLPMSQMVLDAIKTLRKRNGASVEAIVEYMKGHRRVDAKLVKSYVTRYLQSAVQKGLLEQMGRAQGDRRFKIKKAEKVAKAVVKQKIVKAIRK